MKKATLFILAIFSAAILSGQTASVTLGCGPLAVDFTSPELDSYYWEFGDGNFSELMNPSHTYVSAGIYTATLFDGVSGPKIGDIEITVLAQPEIIISANETEGCSPFQVQFTNESIVDPNAQITGYFWNFGDGGNSTEENPVYTYSQEGTYTVSLKILSSLENCEVTTSFEDFITVSGNVNAGFSIDNSVICDAPATFNLTNNTVDMSGYTYLWDFGNGQTATSYNPPPATYDDEGIYTISLKIDNGEGCVVNLSRNVTVGKPKIDISFPDTVCLGRPFFVYNDTEANAFSWTFGSGAQPQATSLEDPQVVFNQSGPQIVTFSAIASSECAADTFFTVFVEDPSASFAIDPIILCTDPAVYTFTHPESGHKIYEWLIRELDTLLMGGPEYVFTYDEPDRDSFYISRPDTFTVLLGIETQAGCNALDSVEFVHWAPHAHFVPNVSRGCAPLTINFDELSVSYQDIISWDWVFGDGTTASTNTADDMTHTYTEPGEYYVQLTIENEDGCRNTSTGVWIYVGEPIDSEFTFDKTEICLYDTVNFEALNLDPRIDAWHFDTDEGRISHCYESPLTSHAFIHAPGTYPVSLTIEYNGCYNEINNGETITVNGTKSRIRFMTNCIDPYTVMLQDSSLNASSSIWFVNGDTINMDTIPGDIFNYTFDTTGNYVVRLITDDDTSCPKDTSEVDIYIRDIEANFEFPEKLCASTPYELNASMSVDVDETCSKGYEWFGIANRPRQVDYPIVQAAWAPGPITVRLIVEDLNGCKDTLDKQSEAFQVTADFLPDREKMCYPSEISFTDQSVGDTTLVDWSWSFGSDEQNPQDFEFLTGPTPFLPVQLIVKDVLGCVDTTEYNIPVYEVSSSISANPGTIVCIGETIDFMASDYNEEGSFLHFDWNFGPLGSSMEQNPSLEITQDGTIPISLTIVEDSTGCSNKYDLVVQGIIPPTADFEIDLENTARICPNEIVLFTNNSTLNGPGGYMWDFGNGSTSNLEEASAFFDEGTFDISLTVSSIYGCSDTHTDQIFLEGPDGNFTMDKDFLCLGDTVNFNIIDTSDVHSILWDFGDGTKLENVGSNAHAYTFLPDTLQGMLSVSLVIESSNGCPKTIVNAINLSDLRTAFEYIQDTTSVCQREIEFINMTEGGDTFAWDFGTGDTSNEESPIYTYQNEGVYTVSLTAENADGTCRTTISSEISIDTLMEVEIPTVFSPNNDNRNDYFDIIIEENQRECVEVVRSKIFNRWGNMIYDNELPLEGWNGKYENGEDAPAEVYTYVLEVVYTNGDVLFKKGTFTLIR